MHYQFITTNNRPHFYWAWTELNPHNYGHFSDNTWTFIAMSMTAMGIDLYRNTGTTGALT